MSSNNPFEPLDLTKFDLSSLEVSPPPAAAAPISAPPAASMQPTIDLKDAEVKGFSPQYTEKLKQVTTSEQMPRTWDPYSMEAPEQKIENILHDDLSTMELRGEDLDTGLPQATLLDKIKSFSTALGISAARTSVAPLLAAGEVGMLDDQDYRIWQNQPPEEQRKSALSKAVGWIARLGMYDEASTAGAWGLANAGDIEAKAQKIGKDGGEVFNDMLTRLDNLEKDKVLPGFWTDQLPQATGTTAAFLLAGTAAGVASAGAVAPWAVTGFLGAALGAEQGIEDAVAAGATPSQAQLAAAVGTLLGTTEAVPIIRILERADNATGGLLSRRLNRVFQQKLVGGVLREGLKGALDEGLQEVVQQVGTDLNAMLTYDPDRSLLENATKAGESAGASGFLLSAAASALGIPLRARQQRAQQEQIRQQEQERVVGAPAGPEVPFEQLIERNANFTPLTPGYSQLQTDVVQNLEKIEDLTRGNRLDQPLTTTEVAEGLAQGAKTKPLGIDLGTGHLLQKDFYSNLEKFEVNPFVEKDLAGTIDVKEALKKQPVVVAGLNDVQEKFQIYREQLKQMEAEMAASPEAAARYANGYRHGLKRLEILEQQANLEKSIAEEAKNIAAGVREQFFSPDTKVVLSGEKFAQGQVRGAMWSSSDGKLLHIGLNMTNIAAAAENNPEKMRVMAREVLLHELGHAMVYQNLEAVQKKVAATLQTPEQVQQNILNAKRPTEKLYWSDVAVLQNRAAEKGWTPGSLTGLSPATTADIVLYRGLMQEYVTWAGKRLSEQPIERWRTISSPSTLADVESIGPDVRFIPKYHLNFDEFMAENFSRLATQNPIATKSVRNFFAQHRAMLEKLYAPYATLPSMPTFEGWINHMSFQGQLAEEIKKMAGVELDRYSILRSPEKARELGLNPDMMKGFQAGNDNYQKWYRFGLNILQLGRLNPHIEPLQNYIRLANLFNQKISRFRWRGHNTLKDWRAVGSKQATLIGTTLMQETLDGKALSPDQMRAMGLNEESIKAVAQIKDDFKTVLDRMEQVLLGEVNQNFAHDPVTLEHELKRVSKEIAEMRSKPFFPLMRFGRYTVAVRNEEGKLIEFQTFETERERGRHIGEIRARHAGATIGQGYLTDSQAAVQGMPGPILRALRKKLADTGNLTREMEEAIDGMLQDSLPIESFRNHFARRKKIAGFSEDAMRGYATYMVQAATHLARIEMQSDLNQQVNDLRRDSREITRQGRNGTKRGLIADMTGEHLTYMMNPQNDWPMLRSVGFAMFLGMNLKSAFVNSTQIFLATHPYLSARFGELSATKALAKAVDLHTRKFQGKELPPDVTKMLEEGKAQGWLDESFATELAVARSTKYTTATVPVTTGSRIWTKFSEILSWPFSTVEKMNRNLTAIATYNLYRGDGADHYAAVQMAREAVQATQGEYAKWARPKFMTGKVGANVFLFKGYTQNQLFLALGNDPAASRVLFSTLVLAGLMGLPFAEDLLDLLDVAGTKLKRALGWNNPKVQSRLFIRDTLREMQMNPDLFMYGLGESSMGLGFLGDVTGFPIPQVDVQGSLSMGNIVPGTSALKKLQAGDSSAALLDFLREAGGAEASYLGQAAQAIVSDNPDNWRRWELSLPAFLKGLSRAGRYAQQGGEFDNRGQPIAEFDPTNTQDQMEVAAQALGFTPSRVNKGWEEYMAEREVVTYYEAWRRSTMNHFNAAYTNEDDGDRDAAMKELQTFNESVPYPEMKISSDALNKSLQEYARQRALAGKSVPAQRSIIRLTREIQEKYSE